MKPNVAVLKAQGTNFDEETHVAFSLAGANPTVVLMSEILQNPRLLLKFQILDFPGGFSYGDDLYSGKIWANEILIYLKDVIKEFIKKGGLVIGVCNGFQVLVRAGLLPGFGDLNNTIGLINNEKGKFECRWVRISARENACVFLKNTILSGELPVEHGEGRFIVKDEQVLERLKKNKQIVFQYMKNDKLATEYPDNPNGSAFSIAGICDETGQILGMMPHPEHSMFATQYPNWRRGENDPFGIKIYKHAVRFMKEG